MLFRSIAADALNDPNESLVLCFPIDAARSKELDSTVSVLHKESTAHVISNGNDVITRMIC